MKTIAAAVVCILASISTAELESGSLSLLQTAAEVKSHHHVSAEWMPGTGYVVNKCGEGGNLADIRPDLAGWTGGDAHAVGTQKIDNAGTKEGCIENVLKDPRCQLQDKKAEIDARNNQPEYVARGKPFKYTIAAGYAPGQGKCFCSWGTVESQKDGTGNPMSGGWITCLARGGAEPVKETKPLKEKKGCKVSKATRAEIKAARKALRDLRAQMKAARKVLRDAKAKGKAECEKVQKEVVCTPESCPKTDDDTVACGKGWTQGEGTGLALTRVVIGWPSNPPESAAACVTAIKADSRCDDMDTVTYVDPQFRGNQWQRLQGYCSCNGKVDSISPMDQYIACSLRRPWSAEK